MKVSNTHNKENTLENSSITFKDQKKVKFDNKKTDDTGELNSAPIYHQKTNLLIYTIDNDKQKAIHLCHDLSDKRTVLLSICCKAGEGGLDFYTGGTHFTSNVDINFVFNEEANGVWSCEEVCINSQQELGESDILTICDAYGVDMERCNLNIDKRGTMLNYTISLNQLPCILSPKLFLEFNENNNNLCFYSIENSNITQFTYKSNDSNIAKTFIPIEWYDNYMFSHEIIVDSQDYRNIFMFTYRNTCNAQGRNIPTIHLNRLVILVGDEKKLVFNEKFEFLGKSGTNGNQHLYKHIKSMLYNKNLYKQYIDNSSNKEQRKDTKSAVITLKKEQEYFVRTDSTLIKKYGNDQQPYVDIHTISGIVKWKSKKGEDVIQKEKEENTANPIQEEKNDLLVDGDNDEVIWEYKLDTILAKE